MSTPNIDDPEPLAPNPTEPTAPHPPEPSLPQTDGGAPHDAQRGIPGPEEDPDGLEQPSDA